MPSQIKDDAHRSEGCRGNAGITFGRQIGAYPILVGLPYHAPLESVSNAIVTGHGKRSITAVEVGIDINEASQKQLEAIPGIGENSAWRIISERVKRKHKGQEFKSVDEAFKSIEIDIPKIAKQVLVV